MGGFLNNFVIPIVATIAPIIPTIDIPQGESTAYAESLLKEYHGEWEFDTNKKLMLSPDVTTDWISAIYKGQKMVWDGLDIKVPVLAMYSSCSVDGSEWSEEFMHGDAVLNIEDIALYSQTLGENVQRAKIVGGLHDLLCSRPEVRERAYRYIFYFLERN
jgi:alpha-beta hydrolase superfamily lysophospholipase